MKKIGIVLLLVFAVVYYGCAPDVQTFKVFDSVTGLPFNGTAMVNGKKTVISNGILRERVQKIDIEADGYKEEKTSNKNIYLVPEAYIELRTNALPETVSLNGKRRRIFLEENGKYLVSPVPKGNVLLKISGMFCKTLKKNIVVKDGKNVVALELKPDTAKIKSFLQNSGWEDGDYSVSVKGKIDEDNMDYTLNVTLENGKVTNITYKGLNISFNGEKPVCPDAKSKEDVAALLYEKNTLENLFGIQNYVTSLPNVSVNGNAIILSGKRMFENRKLEESVSIYTNENRISVMKIHIESSEIENADITLVIRKTNG